MGLGKGKEREGGERVEGGGDYCESLHGKSFDQFNVGGE